MAVLVHACFEAGPRWGALAEDEREAIVQYAIRVVRDKWDASKADPLARADVEKVVNVWTERNEEWRVGMQDGAARLFLALPAGKYHSAYVHTLDEIPSVMKKIRRALREQR